MSAIAALYNVPSTPDELNSWAFSHMAHHRDIIRVIYLATGTNLTEYPLDPIDPSNMGAWIYQHQLMHQDMDAILDIAGYDLTDVDWKDQGQLAGWVLLNSIEHTQAANILRIG